MACKAPLLWLRAKQSKLTIVVEFTFTKCIAYLSFASAVRTDMDPLYTACVLSAFPLSQPSEMEVVKDWGACRRQINTLTIYGPPVAFLLLAVCSAVSRWNRCGSWSEWTGAAVLGWCFFSFENDSLYNLWDWLGTETWPTRVLISKSVIRPPLAEYTCASMNQIHANN